MILKILKGSRQSGFFRRCTVFFLSVVMVVVSYSFLWAGDCPQPRFTAKAPPDIYNRVNLLNPSMENILAGKALYEEKAKPMACKLCHGIKGKAAVACRWVCIRNQGILPAKKPLIMFPTDSCSGSYATGPQILVCLLLKNWKMRKSGS